MPDNTTHVPDFSNRKRTRVLNVGPIVFWTPEGGWGMRWKPAKKKQEEIQKAIKVPSNMPHETGPVKPDA